MNNRCPECGMEPFTDSVPMPQTADQAELMLRLGHLWLRDNAPERLIPEPIRAT